MRVALFEGAPVEPGGLEKKMEDEAMIRIDVGGAWRKDWPQGEEVKVEPASR